MTGLTVEKPVIDPGLNGDEEPLTREVDWTADEEKRAKRK